jgi:putative FmdB family regulatory protein
MHLFLRFWGGPTVPLYEYKCQKCGRHTEKLEKVAGPHLKKCPHCGGAVERLLSPPAVQFKGTGWYVTDYAGKSASKDAGDHKSGESKETGGKEAKEPAAKDSKSGDAKESREKKPLKKK